MEIEILKKVSYTGVKIASLLTCIAGLCYTYYAPNTNRRERLYWSLTWVCLIFDEVFAVVVDCSLPPSSNAVPVKYFVLLGAPLYINSAIRSCLLAVLYFGFYTKRQYSIRWIWITSIFISSILVSLQLVFQYNFLSQASLTIKSVINCILLFCIGWDLRKNALSASLIFFLMSLFELNLLSYQPFSESKTFTDANELRNVEKELGAILIALRIAALTAIYRRMGIVVGEQEISE
jgi:hypothetical protein